MSGLQIKDIVKAFDGKNVLANISASIQEGEFVSFVGPSGCGKSTLLNMIASVEEPTSGEVFYNEEYVKNKMLLVICRNKIYYYRGDRLCKISFFHWKLKGSLKNKG